MKGDPLTSALIDCRVSGVSGRTPSCVVSPWASMGNASDGGGGQSGSLRREGFRGSVVANSVPKSYRILREEGWTGGVNRKNVGLGRRDEMVSLLF